MVGASKGRMAGLQTPLYNPSCTPSNLLDRRTTVHNRRIDKSIAYRVIRYDIQLKSIQSLQFRVRKTPFSSTLLIP